MTSGGRNAARRRESRDALLRAALELFATRGYQHTTLSDISAAAAVSHGLVNYYFPSKQDLLHELVRQQLAAMLHLVIAVDTTDPDVAMATLIDAWLDGLHSDPDGSGLMLSLMIQPEVRAVYRASEIALSDDLVRAEGVLIDLLRRRGDDDAEVSVILLRSVIDGVLFKGVIYRESYPIEAIRRRIYALVGLPAPNTPRFPAPGFGDGRHLRMPPPSRGTAAAAG